MMTLQRQYLRAILKDINPQSWASRLLHNSSHLEQPQLRAMLLISILASNLQDDRRPNHLAKGVLYLD
jgi:hypothetical protein